MELFSESFLRYRIFRQQLLRGTSLSAGFFDSFYVSQNINAGMNAFNISSSTKVSITILQDHTLANLQRH